MRYLALLLLVGCPRPADGPPTSVPIRCGTQAIADCGPAALPAVDMCLDGAGDITACLMGLVRPVGCVTYEVIACLVRGEGNKAEHMVQTETAAPKMGVMGPAGSVNWHRAERAKEFLSRTGAKFAE